MGESSNLLHAVEPVSSPREWLTTRQLAAELAITERTLERYRALGLGPPYARLNGRLIRYAREDVRRWIKDQRVGFGDESEGD